MKKFAIGNWYHHFGVGSKETRCRIVIDLEQSKLIAAQEWTGLKFEDILGDRLMNLAESVIDVNQAHAKIDDWAPDPELTDDLPDWANPRKVARTTQMEGAVLASVPSGELKSAVLNAVYHLDGIKVLSGFQFLAAQHLKTKVGIFVVAGNFGRDHFKMAYSEAKAAGLNTGRMYVYGQTATYSGNAICFSKFEEIGINLVQAFA